jgi:hypothetical protein
MAHIVLDKNHKGLVGIFKNNEDKLEFNLSDSLYIFKEISENEFLNLKRNNKNYELDSNNNLIFSNFETPINFDKNSYILFKNNLLKRVEEHLECNTTTLNFNNRLKNFCIWLKSINFDDSSFVFPNSKTLIETLESIDNTKETFSTLQIL